MYRKVTSVTYEEFISEFFPGESTELAESPAPSVLSHLPIRTLRKRTTTSSKATTQKSRNSSCNLFSRMPTPKSDAGMYQKLSSAINKAKICDGFTFVSTPHTGKAGSDAEKSREVDCGMYPNSVLDQLKIASHSKFSRRRRTDWSLVEIAVECHLNGADDDPFDETIDVDEPLSEGRRKVLDQVLYCAERVFQHQHRTCQYLLLFVGKFARMVRIDRSGIFAAERFDYREDGAKLVTFLRSYTRCSPADRGHDPTAVRLDPESDEAKRMKARVENVLAVDYAGQQFKASLAPEWPWWQLEVPDEHNDHKKQHFLVGKPHFQKSGVLGRATRGYVALDANDNLVYLKDAWRIFREDIDQEGATLEALRPHKIDFVPTLICHGDIPGQEAKTQALWPKYHPEEHCHLKRHQHYRIVVEEVGKPLEEFENGLQLLTVIFCAVYAHSQAYKNGIIHRDISDGNILLYQETPGGDWLGLLTDWELAKQVAHQPSEGQQFGLTGTWAFLSAKILNNHSKTTVIQDELESLFHVTLYMALRFLPNNCMESEVPRLIHNYFDDYAVRSNGEHICGIEKRTAMSLGRIDISGYNIDGSCGSLRFLWPGEKCTHPLDELFRTLLSWFGAYYTLARMPAPDDVMLDLEEENTKEPEDTHIPADDGFVVQSLAHTGGTDDNSTNPGRGMAKHSLTGLQPPSLEPSNASPAVLRATRLERQKQRHQEELEREKRYRTELEKLAKNLETHDPMLQEIIKALEKGWPPFDRCENREPKNGWVPRRI